MRHERDQQPAAPVLEEPVVLQRWLLVLAEAVEAASPRQLATEDVAGRAPSAAVEPASVAAESAVVAAVASPLTVVAEGEPVLEAVPSEQASEAAEDQALRLAPLAQPGVGSAGMSS